MINEKMMTQLAPIALFVYNRLDNTKETIEHLKANLLSEQSELYIFSDGGKDEKSWEKVNKLRAYLHTITGFKSITIVERPVNFYLERNIIEGISEVLEKRDKIIVLEDDICTSPYFLKYMNEALDLYQDEPRVMHIAGFTNLDLKNRLHTYFTPHMTGWGWATWKDRWMNHFVHYQSRQEALSGLTEQDKNEIQYGGAFQCLKSLDKDPIPWDICWEIAIYKANGLCLHPYHTLVKNIGIYGGTHFGSLKNSKLFGKYEFDRNYIDHPIKIVKQEISANHAIESEYAKAFVDHGKRYNLLGKIVRGMYLKFCKK